MPAAGGLRPDLLALVLAGGGGVRSLCRRLIHPGLGETWGSRGADDPGDLADRPASPGWVLKGPIGPPQSEAWSTATCLLVVRGVRRSRHQPHGYRHSPWGPVALPSEGRRNIAAIVHTPPPMISAKLRAHRCQLRSLLQSLGKLHLGTSRVDGHVQRVLTRGGVGCWCRRAGLSLRGARSSVGWSLRWCRSGASFA